MSELGSGSGTSIPNGIDTKQTYINVSNPDPDSSLRMDAELVNDILDTLLAFESDLYRVRFIDARTYTLFTDAVAAATNKTLLICSSINLASNTTIPSTVSVMVLRPGIINSNGFTLNINGSIVGNPLHQWLSGFVAGQITITNMPEILSVWLGTSVTAINLTIDALSNVHLLPGTIAIDNSINIDQTSVKLKGSGSHTYGTILQKLVDGIAQAVNITSLNGGLEDVQVDCNGKTLNGVVVAAGNNNEIRNIRIRNVGGTGIGLLVNDASANKFYNSQIGPCANGIEVRGTGSSNVNAFYSCTASTEGYTGIAYNVNAVGNVIHSVWANELFVEPGTGKAVYILNASASGIRGLYLEAAYLNTSVLIHITGANCIGFIIDVGLIAQTHASFTQNMITVDGGAINTILRGLYLQKTSNNITPMISIDAATGVKIENITVYCTTANNILTTSVNSVGVVCENVVATSGAASAVSLAGTGHKWVGGTSNITITIVSGASNIIIENFPGNIVVESSTTRIILSNCTGSITGAGAGVVIKLIQAAANADTSGVTLGQLETEVNELKTLLRNTGLLAT